MPKELSKTGTSTNHKPYSSSSTSDSKSSSPSVGSFSSNGKLKNVEYIWEPYMEQQPKNKIITHHNNTPSPQQSHSSVGTFSQLLFPSNEEQPFPSFSYSPSEATDIFGSTVTNNILPTGITTTIESGNQSHHNMERPLSPTATGMTTTVEEPFKNQNDLSSLTSASFHIACTACREKHIKCDKKIPSCTYCIKHGLICQYRKPKKRGRPSSKNKGNNNAAHEEEEHEGYSKFDIVKPTTESSSSSGMQSFTSHTFHINDASTNPSSQFLTSVNNADSHVNNWLENPLNKNNNATSMSTVSRLPHASSSNATTALMIPQLNTTEIDVPGFSQMPQVDFNNESLIALIRMSRDLNKQLMKRLTVDDYYRSTSMPLMDQRSVEHIFFSDKRSDEANCFLYSIHMLMCQRRGFKDEAERAYEKTRSMLSHVFDQWRSFLTACTYCNLSIYCSGEGNDGDAIFYLSFVDYYFTQLKEKYSLGQQNLKYLKSIAEMAAGIGSGTEKPVYDDFSELDLESISKQCQHDVANLLVGFYKYTTGLKKVPPELLQITSQSINQDTIYLYLTLFDLITKLVTQHESDRQKTLTPEQEEISKAICDAFINGTRVLILQQCGYKGKVLEDAANRIAEIFSNEISIGFASPLYMSSVIAACQVHIGIIEEIESGLRSNYEFGVDYYAMIDKDLKAMNYLDKQFGRVRKRYSQIIYQLESIKKRRETEVSKLVISEIERLKTLRTEGKSTSADNKSFLLQEHLTSLYSLVREGDGTLIFDPTSSAQPNPLVGGFPSSSVETTQTNNTNNVLPTSSELGHPRTLPTTLEESFEDILNNL